jgi:hypothetical protein
LGRSFLHKGYRYYSSVCRKSQNKFFNGDQLVTPLEKVSVVIRSVGERTEAVCRQLILEQGVAEKAVFVIHEAPFSRAMRVGFEIGLSQGRPWTFCVDADLLLRPDSVARMVSLAEKQAENVCEVQGYILDKLFGGPRTGGVHLYRTKLLDRVLAAIPAEGINIRPEFHTLIAMKDAGFPWVEVPELLALHDFEQRYTDIYRKCFVHAHKHANFTDLFLSIWREGAPVDPDYRVALAGFARGIEHYGEVHIDARSALFRSSVDALGLTDKPAMEQADWSLDRVEATINNWTEPGAYRAKFPTRMGLVPTTHRFTRLKKRLGNKGLAHTSLYVVGRLLQGVGSRIQHFAAKLSK